MKDVIDYYRCLLNKSNIVLYEMEQSVEITRKLVLSHNYLDDYGLLRMAIKNRPEVTVFDSAIKEYQFSLYALVCGQYRYSFTGLRLFFELTLAAIQFSAHEIKYRSWEKGCQDINWGALSNEQNGVLSVDFIKAFNPDFSGFSKQYLSIAMTVYRECSEFVHGNIGTHAVLPSEIVFKDDVFLKWHEKSYVIRMVIIFAFSARYLNYIPEEEKDKLEPLIMEVLGNLPPIQCVF